jgi:hypothetical protein
VTGDFGRSDKNASGVVASEGFEALEFQYPSQLELCIINIFLNRKIDRSQNLCIRGGRQKISNYSEHMEIKIKKTSKSHNYLMTTSVSKAKTQQID